MRGLRKLSKPSRGRRRFPKTADAKALEATRLCRYAHEELHRMGQRAWEERWGISLSVEQAKVWSEYLKRRGG